jgi:hypothetical protein
MAPFFVFSNEEFEVPKKKEVKDGPGPVSA